MLNPNFVIVGVLISSLGSIVYLIDTLKGKIKPNKVSFLMWSIVPFIAFAAQIKQGVGLESLMTFSAGFLPLVIFLGSFVNRQANWKITRFDLACGFLSLTGLILWIVTKTGNVAIFFSILADGLAAVPTIAKSYKFPDTELGWPWGATAFGSVLTLFTLNKWTFTNSGFIIYLFSVNILIFILIQFRLGERLSKIKLNRI